MRIPFATICVAIAVFRAGVGSYAAPPRSIPQASRSLLGVVTKRHLRSDKLKPDDEERVEVSFDLNKLPGEEEIVGKQASLRTETEQLKLLKEREQLVKSIASDEKKTIDELLYGWKQSFASFGLELKKAKNIELKQLLKGGQKNQESLKEEAEESRMKLLNGWTVPDEPIESESKSSTEGLQAWLEKKESAENKEPVDNVKSAYELFKVLGIHKAVDEAANSLLISMNLERWNFVMMSLHKPGEYSFEDKLLETLKAHCGDDDRAKLFLEHLIILRRKTDLLQLFWLRREQEPGKALCLMYPNEQIRYVDENLEVWIPYLEAYKDLNPKKQVILFTALGQSEDYWIETIFAMKNNLPYPKAGSIRRRIVEEIFKSWAALDPPLSPARVLIRSKNPPDSAKFTPMQDNIVEQYLIFLNAVRSPDAQLREESVKNSLKDKDDLIKSLIEEKKTLSDTTEIDDYLKSLESENPSKRKADSPPEDAREERRPRGE